MKVNWIATAAIMIAAALGVPLVSSGQSPTYTIADYTQPPAAPQPGPDPDAKAPAKPADPVPTVQPLAPAPAAEEEAEEEEEETCDPWRLFGQKECGWNINGWVNGGYTYNPDGGPFNGPVTFNDQNTFILNQLYIIGEQAIDRETCCWNWGGRVDVLYGSDYIFTQSNGWETDLVGGPKWNGNPYYGLAIPQLYAEVGNELNSIKIGHFYTPIGYEVVPATGNFFYSHAYTMQYGEPFTHWGFLGSYKWNDELALTYGLVNGWDALNRARDDASIILGFVWTGCRGEDTLAFNIIYGNEPVVDDPTVYTKRYMHSLVYTHKFCCDWQYVFQHDFAQQNDGARGGGAAAEWYGINQYLFYTINDCWKSGLRFEWFRDDDGVRVTGLRAGNPIVGSGFAGSFYELALGLNWTPTANWTIRGEVRYDKFDGVAVAGALPQPYGNGTRSDQTLLALDAIFLW